MTLENKIKERFDWALFFLLFLFFLISVTAISSAETTATVPSNYALNQVIYYIAGVIIIAVVMFFDMEQYKMMAWYVYGIGLALLITLFLVPTSMLGGPNPEEIRSWLKVPKLGNLQPSEFMKVFLIIALSKIISQHHLKWTEKTVKTDFWLLIKIGITTLVPLALVAIQPDLGTSLVFIAIFVGLVLVSGITWKIFLPSLLTIGAIGASALWLVIYHPGILEKYLGLKPYAFARIYTWIDPYSYSEGYGYNLIQVLNAIGSGQLAGKGFQQKEVYVPEQHTDFIFSVIGEEFGFIGASLVIVLYFLLIYHIVRVSLATKDPFSSYICAGVITMITFHILENIGMSLQLLPITGIPLPFISYGGSSLMGNMFAMGLIFSIRYHHKTYMFSSKEQ